MVVTRLAVMVVARANDSVATTEGYRGDGGSSDKDDSKSNSTGNAAATRRHLCLIFFFFGRAHDKVTRFVFLLDT